MKQDRRRIRKRVGRALRFCFAALTFAILLYVVFALAFSTDEEKRLARENQLYEERYAMMMEREQMLSAAIESLQERDNALYEGLFHTVAPALDPLDAADAIAHSDSLSESFFLSYSASKSENVRKMADRVEDNFRDIFDAFCARRDSIPPLSAPVADFSAAQPGASVGMKYNPMLRIDIRHDGLDLIVPQGEPVLAAADGRVSAIVRGSYVEIDHRNGYKTRYCCLDEIRVSVGMNVARGRKIGTVGISRGAFVPHLHFEVLRGDTVLDPVHYLFSALGPDEYATVLYTAVTTAQSLD